MSAGTQIFDWGTDSEGVKRYFLLSAGAEEPVSATKPEELGEVEAAIAFLEAAWAGSPPQVLVAGDPALVKAAVFRQFLQAQGVALHLPEAFSCLKACLEWAMYQELLSQ
jgi:hypothetical protein